jgi:hypothetical protein
MRNALWQTQNKHSLSKQFSAIQWNSRKKITCPMPTADKSLTLGSTWLMITLKEFSTCFSTFCTFIEISGLYTIRHWLSYLHCAKRTPFCVTKRRVAYSLRYNHEVHTSKLLDGGTTPCTSRVLLTQLILTKKNTPTALKAIQFSQKVVS